MNCQAAGPVPVSDQSDADLGAAGPIRCPVIFAVRHGPISRFTYHSAVVLPRVSGTPGYNRSYADVWSLKYELGDHES